nr:MAG TPA: hypothetical protein [Caudoviricetes sp.]
MTYLNRVCYNLITKQKRTHSFNPYSDIRTITAGVFFFII